MRALILCLALYAPLQAASPLFESSFEHSDAGWTTLRGAATPDPAVTFQNHKSLRVEPGPAARDAAIASAPIPLTIGKRYELTGWIRTDKLAVRDLDRTPIAIGAALTMASMPFDVHSESIGGTPTGRASTSASPPPARRTTSCSPSPRAATFDGKAWFAGVSIDEASSKDDVARSPPRSRPTAPPTAIPSAAGFISTSKASPTNAATSTAV